MIGKRTITSTEIQVLSRRDQDSGFAEIHQPVTPAEIRENDRVLARIRRRTDGGGSYEAIRVWRLSPLGIELIQEQATRVYAKGDSVDLELVLSGQRTTFEGLVVDHVAGASGTEVLGIRLSRKVASTLPGVNRRSSERWICSDEFLPTCVAPTPGRFDDFMYFQVRDISADGLQLSCSLRNKFLIPGMRLELTAVFPMAQVVHLDVEITRVRISSFGGRDRLVVGTKFRTLSDYARTTLGQYILQFSNLETVDDLRKQGLAPKHISYGVDFYNLKTEEDYRSVLELRLMAHLADGNVSEGTAAEDLADIYDARARIVIGKFRGKTVATARIRYNELEEPLEHEAHLVWPSSLPRRDQIIEISRVATHPGFRRGDLLAALFRFVYMNVAFGDRPWGVISCLDHMVPFYEKIGFRPTDLKHTEPQWKPDRLLNIMIANMYDLMLGKGVNPIYWNFMWRDVADYCSAHGMIKPTGTDRARLLIYKAIGPISGLVMQVMKFSRGVKRKVSSAK
jgi:hypothetical protein